MIGRNINFPIYNEDGTSFHDLVLRKAANESSVMSLADKVSGDVYYKDNSLVFTMKEYIVVDDVKYILVSPPTVVREGMVADNSEMKGATKYSLVFYHPMYALGNIPFTDKAVTTDEEQYLSQNKTFSWIGNLFDYVGKIVVNLSGTQWVCRVEIDDVTQPELYEKARTISKDVLTFDKNFISDVLKTGYDTWGIPFIITNINENDPDAYAEEGDGVTIRKYFRIVFGIPANEILDSHGVPFVFQFGQGVGLKNNSRNPRNNKIVTRIVGQGSERNIPYGYPQIRWYGDQDATQTQDGYPIYKGIVGGEYVQLIKHPFTRKNLMPSVYVDDVFNKVSPYLPNGNDNPNYNPQRVIRDYYDAPNSYDNPCDVNNPCVEIHEFEEIYPELDSERNNGIVGAVPYDNVSTNPLETAIPISTFLARITNDLATEGKVTNENERAALNTLYDILYNDEGESHTSNQGGSYTYTCDVTKDTDYYYVKYVSDNINYNVVCIQSGHVIVTTWNDTMNDKGEYVQSYFKITLPRLATYNPNTQQWENGIDLYACASITEKMDINMRSGACIGCTFPVMVDWEDYKRNFYNADGEFDPVIGEGHPRNAERYPDTSQGQVTFIVQKDINTFGTIMPNIYQQPQARDSFVILGISLPTSYITNAQQRLDQEMMRYMKENNVHYFDYPLKFDEYFLAQNVDILGQIRNNSVIRFMYQGSEKMLYVKSITKRYGDKVLPQYDITLTDNIEVVLNPVAKAMDDVNRMKTDLDEAKKTASQDITDLLNEKLSKLSDDVAQGRITFQQGLMSLASTIFGDEIRSNNYKSGTVGGRGWRIDNLGNAEMESLRVRSFLEVTELLINRIQAQEGDTMFTDNDQIDKVEVYNIGGTDIYTLSLKEKYDGYVTSQVKGNILRGVVFVTPAHNAGLTEYTYDDAQESEFGHNFYITSWMQVRGSYGDDPMRTTYPQLAVLKKNQIRVVLYGDGDVPANVNFAPCELMTVVRWGCYQNPSEAATEYERQNIIRRQNVFYISTKDGRLSKLRGVSSPKLRKENYGTTLGTIPDFVREMSIASRLIEGQDYLYAQGIIVGDFIKVDAEGAPIVTFVDCGDWIDGSSLQQPTEGKGIYLFNEYNPNNGQYETHDVWHNGAKWRCLMHQPHNNVYYEPTEANSAYWEKLLDSGESAVNYNVEWSDATGVTTNIPCNANGIAKTIVGEMYSMWIKAMLYRRVGDGNSTLLQVSKIILRAFLEDGTEVIQVDPINSWPKEVHNTSYISLTNNEAYVVANVKYIAEFYDSNNALLTTSSISRTLDGSQGQNGTNGQDGQDGQDGYSAPEYTEEWYAWSNDSSTASVTTAPTISGQWSSSIPNRGNYAYLWKKIIKHTLIPNSKPPMYQAHDAEYFRMNGENGTSIRTKGTVLAVIDSHESSLPEEGEDGEYIIVDGSPNLYKYVDDDWEIVKVFNDGEHGIVKGNDELVYWDGAMQTWEWTSSSTHDGDAYTSQEDGHLWMWSYEAQDWIDLGQFKGEAGKTYYTHIAWATKVETVGSEVVVSGFVTTKTPDDTTHKWMGVLIDENQGDDPQYASRYTWSYIKGVDGQDGQDGAQGPQGERGNVGRWYYYGGVFNADDSTQPFTVSDSMCPFFLHYESGLKRYHVYNPEINPSDNQATMREMWTESQESFNNKPWQVMTNDFDYLITKAIFGEYAQFGSAIINGDWMISTNGYINGEAYNNGRKYNGEAAYKWFDPNHPNEDQEYSKEEQGQTVVWHNFVPNYCVDLLTGAVYMQNAHVKGVVEATSGTFRGTVIASQGNIGGFVVGERTLTNNLSTNQTGGISIIRNTSKAFVGADRVSRDTDVLNNANLSSEFSCNEYGANESTVNIAVRAVANGSGYAHNFALHGMGHISTRGMCVGYRINVIDIQSDNGEYINLKYGNIVLLSGGNDRPLFLPKLSNVRSSLKIAASEPFAVKVTILVSADDMKIKGYQDNVQYTGDDYPPYQRDNDFSNHPNHDCHKGQVYTYMLVWDGQSGHQHYNAWLVGYGDRTY